MAGDFGLPYRPPCGGWPAIRKFSKGSCYQHKRASDAAIPVHANITSVPNYTVPATPATIAPYPRLSDHTDWPSGGDCPGSSPDPTCGVAGMRPCGPWPAASSGLPFSRAAGGIDGNTYSLESSGVLDVSQCRKLGFKAVQARKAWHGRYGFLSHDPGGRWDRVGYVDYALDSCYCMDLETEQPAPDQTKYRTIEYHLEWSLDEQDSGRYGTGFQGSGVINRKMSVDRLSGVLSQTCGPDSGDAVLGESYFANQIGTGPDRSRTLWGTELAAWGGFGWSIAYTRSGATVTATATDPVNGHAGAMSLNADTGEFHLSRYGLDEMVGGWRELMTEDLSFTATTWSYEKSSERFGSFHTFHTLSATGTLTDPYTAEDLQQDVKDLLAEWPLNNDAVYPWRTDELCGIAPLVTRNEHYATLPEVLGYCTVTDEEGATVPWSDLRPLPKPDTAPGAIVGRPLPAGYGPHFDWDHKTWRSCVTDSSSVAHYVYAYGAWSGANNYGDLSDLVIPKTATQWTENWSPDGLTAGEMPPGAWMIFKADRSLLYGQKWAEIKIPRPSHNFARPCGEDRYSVDETTARCVASSVGATVTLDSATAINTGDICKCCGVDGIDGGYYSVTKTGDTTYNLGVRLTAWPAVGPLEAGCGAGTLAKVRFPNAPGICGRLPVVSATQSGPNVALEIAPGAFLRTGDHVDLSGVPGLGADLAVTVTDETHCTVPGTLSGAYASGGWITSHGAAAYYWHDDQARGDFLLALWGFNFRDFAERDRMNTQAAGCPGCPDSAPADPTPIRPYQSGHGMPREVNSFTIIPACISWSVCDPQVLCISPNAEEFGNGYVYGFPGLTIDERYGARWQAAFMTHRADPLWQEPHAPCVVSLEGAEPTTCQHLEDDGSCKADTCIEESGYGEGDIYYPQRPWVEARVSLPGGGGALGIETAPALPEGLSLAFLSLGALDTPSPVDGNVLPPPLSPGYSIPEYGGVDPTTPPPSDYELDTAIPAPVSTPWGIYIREMHCVCEEGRFYSEYQEQGVKIKCP